MDRRNYYNVLPREVQVDVNVDMMISQITEGVIEKTVDRLLQGQIESNSFHFIFKCLYKAWKRIVNWMTFQETYESFNDIWKLDEAPKMSTPDPLCSGVVDHRTLKKTTKKVERSKVKHKKIKFIKRLDSSFTDSYSSGKPTVVKRQYKKKKRKRKKKIESFEEGILRAFRKREFSKATGKSTLKKGTLYSLRNYKSLGSTYTQSGGEPIKRKYVQQASRYISPKSFGQPAYSVSFRIRPPKNAYHSDWDTIKRAMKPIKTVINVKNDPPEII